MNCAPASLVRLARGSACIPRSAQGQVHLALLCLWANRSVFSFGPASSTIQRAIQWIDINGSHTGTLSDFNIHADKASVTSLTMNGISEPPISYLTGLSKFPALTNLTVSNNPSLTFIDISGCPSLINMSFNNNALTVLCLNTIVTALVSFGLHNGFARFDSQTPDVAFSVGPPDGIAAVATLSGVRGWIILGN